MILYEFNNNYDVILGTLFPILNQFENDDQLLAAPWIWWLASSIHCTGIVEYHVQYLVFPFDLGSNRTHSRLDN